MIPRPPGSTLVPYTTLFRSLVFPLLTSDTWPACRPLVEWAVGLLPAGGRGYVRPEWSEAEDRKSTRLNSSHANISYAVFCLKKKTKPTSGLSCQQSSFFHLP